VANATLLTNSATVSTTAVDPNSASDTQRGNDRRRRARVGGLDDLVTAKWGIVR